jgi:polysaccharide deacetylase family protein (PEP-CTERM system associated)
MSERANGAAEPINGFTVDVEDWYQVSDFDAVIQRTEWDRYESRVEQNTERILRLLDEAGVKGTFFVLAWNAERHPQVVRRIAAAGHEIASHGYAHRVVWEQTPDEFREDILRAKGILEQITGTPCVGYRAPSCTITPRSVWALDILIDNGFRYDSSLIPIHDSTGGFPDTPRFPHIVRERDGRTLVEFPVTTARVFGRNVPLGGGGYLRVFPYHYLAWGMRWINRRESQPTMFYIHPWEIDPGQPRIKTAGRRGFSTHYVGLRSAENKVRRLLKEFRFGTMSQVLESDPSLRFAS